MEHSGDPGWGLQVVSWRAFPTHLPPSLQLWYFWRRRLFIWLTFLDSYFEILLYVGPHYHPLTLSSQAWERLGGKGTRLALEAGTRGQTRPCQLPASLGL